MSKSTSKFTVSPRAQGQYTVLGGRKPSGSKAAAKAALAKASASRRSAAIHVTPRENGWAVKTAGTERAASVQPTKAKAVSAARKMAASQRSRLIEHGGDGRIVKNTKPKQTK